MARVISAGADRTTRLWDAKDGKLLATLIGHEGRIQAVSVLVDLCFEADRSDSC